MYVKKTVKRMCCRLVLGFLLCLVAVSYGVQV